METTFSKMLIQLRKDAGFSSAYQFYHDNGGKSVLKMTYRNYLTIEQGQTLPQLERLGAFIYTLRMVHRSAEANAFVCAWLKTMAGEDNFKELIEPLIRLKSDTPELSPAQKAMKKALAAKTCYLTLEQIKVIHATSDNYLCFLAMSSDTNVWKIKKFANCLKLSESVAGKALKAFAGVKLVKEVKKGAYKSLIAGALLRYPDMNTLPPELKKKIRDCNDKLAAAGQEIYPHDIMVRADERDFRNFFPIMDLNLLTADAYSVNEKTEKSALFMVRGRVIKLRDF